MSAVVVNIHLGGLVVVQLLPDVGFILQNNYWSDLFKSETCGQKYLSYFCWLYPAKKLMRPLFKADSRWMWSKIFITKTKEKEKVHLWCEPSPCDQKYLLQTKRERQSSPLVCAESMWSKNKKKEKKREKNKKRERGNSSPLVWAESRACPPFCRIRGTASLRYSRWTWLSAREILIFSYTFYIYFIKIY